MELFTELRYRLAGRRRGRDVRDVLRDWWHAITPHQKQRMTRFAKFGLPPLALLLVLLGGFALRPVPQPDYATADIARIFNFTFLTSEFNRLSVDERIELLGQLMQRMNSMSASESAVLAAFAAGIAGNARAQLEENAARLMIDLWDKHAFEYARIPAEDRAAFINASLVDLTRTLEAISGRPRDISDAQRLAEVQRSADRDREIMRRGDGPPPEAIARMFTFMRDNLGERATPAQRVRAQQLIVDMTRHLRGEPLSGPR
jgi:hypothetical protein